MVNRLRLRAFLLVALLSFLAAGCAIVPKPTESVRLGQADATGECAAFFSSLDERTSEARAIDPGSFRVEGYPYLRVNRFLASFRDEAGEPAAFSAWVNRMQTLDREARRFEIANLPRSEGSSVAATNDVSALNAQVTDCGNLLKEADFQTAEQRDALRQEVSVPNEYLSVERFLGIYPLSRLFVLHGIENWHAGARKTFSTEPPVGLRTVRYVPPAGDDFPNASAIFGRTGRDALGIPDYSPADREALFRIYAPVWEVQTESESDRIGAPSRADGENLAVDTKAPVVYTLLSFTRFGKQILTQLNYVIWFPARPKVNALDVYGGLLDGVNFRVTLDGKGAPLLYETVHNCGCYYKAYPTDRLRVREKIDYAEPPLILQAPALNNGGEYLTVSMETRTHYVQHLYPLPRRLPADAVAYAFAPYDELRSLPDSTGGRRNMFGETGIAPGSERLERFTLWPTGVYSPGAMRQWGRHAVAFVGERHFDDPHSLEKMFVETGSE